MRSCPWCDSKNKKERRIRFGLVPCNNDWHDKDAKIVDAPKPPTLKQQLQQARREGWEQAKFEAITQTRSAAARLSAGLSG